MSNNLFNNVCYLSNYKVFCFSDIYVPKVSDKSSIYYYDIGDYIPTSNYNYVYGSNLLVLDYFNKVIHVIFNNVYYELVIIKNNSIKLSEDSCLYKLIFGQKIFNVIDVYGNFLNVKSIEDLMTAIITYPKINVYLTESKYCSEICDTDYSNNVLITEIRTLDDDNHVIINGKYNPCENIYSKGDVVDSVNIGAYIKESIYNEAIELYKSRWFLKNSTSNKASDLLLNIRLLYLAVENDIRVPFTYFNNDLKYATHIGKISNYLKEFVCCNDEDEINTVLDLIFFNAEFDEDYEDFIISTISISIDNANEI